MGQTSRFVNASAGNVDAFGVNVGGKNLYVQRVVSFLQEFIDKDCDGISLFARSTGCDPNSQFSCRCSRVQQCRQYPQAHLFKRVRVAKEFSDADQQVRIQQLQFLWMDVETFEIVFETGLFGQNHAAFNTSAKHFRFVLLEIYAKFVVQQMVDAAFSVHRLGELLNLGIFGVAFNETTKTDQGVWDIINRGNQVNNSSVDCRSRHTIKLGRLLALHDYQAAGVMNFSNPACTIITRTRKYDSNSRLANVRGKLTKEIIDWFVDARRFCLFDGNQNTILNRQIFAAWQDVDIVRFQR